MKGLLLLFAAFGLSVYGKAVVKYKDVVYTGCSNHTLKVDRYIGIPYARPPVGKLRLQSPLPIAMREGCVDASHPTSSKCYGIENYLLRPGSEDCLTLDIIRPTGRIHRMLPVYVFLHG